MRTRQEIKAIGKDRFFSHYWPCVGAAVLVMLAIYAVSCVALIPYFITYFTTVLTNLARMESIAQMNWGALGASMGFAEAVIFICVGPLTIGLCYFFVQVILGSKNEISVGTPFTSAFTGFGRKLGGYLWMQLFTFLWSLLFLIPGIIKSFSYAMTPYILSDCPNVKATDALKLSMRIMRGHKWQFFVFGLSFIGWALLCPFTFGILPIFFVYPYMYSASACWYLEVREEALQNGIITMGQLEGTEPV